MTEQRIYHCYHHYALKLINTGSLETHLRGSPKVDDLVHYYHPRHSGILDVKSIAKYLAEVISNKEQINDAFGEEAVDLVPYKRWWISFDAAWFILSELSLKGKSGFYLVDTRDGKIAVDADKLPDEYPEDDELPDELVDTRYSPMDFKLASELSSGLYSQPASPEGKLDSFPVGMTLTVETGIAKTTTDSEFTTTTKESIGTKTTLSRSKSSPED